MKASRIVLAAMAAATLVVILAACGGGAAQPTAAPTPSGDAAKGQADFAATCAACHGPDAKGLPNLGKDLVTSEFVTSKSDAELVEFLKVGRPTTDPLNTTGVAMPARGGNAAFTDQDLADIVAYLRTIHQ